MNYEEKSDFQINKAVAEVLGLKLSNHHNNNFGYYETIGAEGVMMFLRVSDYCNNPSVAWPIITENRINMIAEWPGKNWYCNVTPTVATIESYRDENLLRAAMIVFLKMKDK